VVRIVRDVARALAHAHARGVLHRDVKPSNVMLTPEHEVRLVDFGLAEVADAGRLTRSGAQLGSLHYMAPEQVLGRGGEIGPRTDVYGLGVTLYELLTLRVPFDAPDPRALQRRVVEGHPPSPRRFNRQLSDDLVTVCACALDPEPGRRYASMADLEQDLASLLAFRPICARRAGVLRRARWWARRHPAAALAVALGLFIVVGGPIGYVVQERRARARVEGALERADRRLEDARGVLGVASQVAREMLHQPGNEEARRRLREKTVEFYLSALEEDRDDPSAVRFGASVRRELARDRRFGGDYAGAEAPLREAIALLEGLPRAERTAWADLARAAVLQDLGGTLVPQGDVGQAMELFEQASAIVDATLARDPRDVAARDQSARIRWRMGLAARSRGDLAAAEELLLEAAAIERGLVAESGDPPRVAGLANTLRNIASVRREAGHLDVALAGAREAYERVSWALARDSEERFARMEHAYVLAELALALGAQGADDEAERHFAAAVAAARALHAQGAWDLNALRALVWVELEQAEHVERRDPARCADLLPELEAAAAMLLQQGGELPLLHSYTSRVAVLRALGELEARAARR
jgi:tetratricopeptide (TPR) repeat protein